MHSFNTSQLGQMEIDRRHYELLRFECIKLATAGLATAEVMKLASELYREVTGRDWPTWKEKAE